MLVDMNREANEKFEMLRTELKRSSLILGVTASSQRLGENFHQSGFKIKADTGVFSITPSNVNVDYEYLDVYGIKLKEGRKFSKDVAADKDMAFIINESFEKELGIKDPCITKSIRCKCRCIQRGDMTRCLLRLTEHVRKKLLHM
jgi:putative ABC transport system permease protein